MAPQCSPTGNWVCLGGGSEREQKHEPLSHLAIAACCQALGTAPLCPKGCGQSRTLSPCHKAPQSPQDSIRASLLMVVVTWCYFPNKAPGLPWPPCETVISVPFPMELTGPQFLGGQRGSWPCTRQREVPPRCGSQVLQPPRRDKMQEWGQGHCGGQGVPPWQWGRVNERSGWARGYFVGLLQGAVPVTCSLHAGGGG